MTEEIAVVAAELDDEIVGAESQLVDHRPGVATGVLDPARRVRREIGVLGENLGRAHVLRELDEPTLLARVNAQRVERLHPVELVGPQEALAEWRHAEVDERLRQRRATKAACRAGGGDGDVVGQRLDRHGRCSLTDESSDVRRLGASGHRIVIGRLRPWR